LAPVRPGAGLFPSTSASLILPVLTSASFFFTHPPPPPTSPLSLPRRSSDLPRLPRRHRRHRRRPRGDQLTLGGRSPPRTPRRRGDRKSTRLNSSHVKISYAVFCFNRQTRPVLRGVRADGRRAASTRHAAPSP